MGVEGVKLPTVQQYEYNGAKISVDLVANEIVLSEKSREIIQFMAGEEVPASFRFEAADLTEKMALIKEAEEKLNNAKESSTRRIALATLAVIGSLILTAAAIVGLVLAIIFFPPFTVLFVALIPVIVGIPSIPLSLSLINFYIQVTRESELEEDLTQKNDNFNGKLEEIKSDNKDSIYDNYNFYINNESKVIAMLNQEMEKIQDQIEAVKSLNHVAPDGEENGKNALLAHAEAKNQFVRQVAFYKQFSLNAAIAVTDVA